ncbi:MAG TPA: hypothetical protein VG713_08915, partial [Pirellulales bacterium]|nr:hypothetical protein [Pirellulales bacterium]
VLAEAGLDRLALAGHVTQVLQRAVMLPAVGQGALGIEVRESDQAVRQALAALDDRNTHCSVAAERAMLRALSGGCLAPVGAWGRVEDNGVLRLDAVVLSTDGRTRITGTGNAIGTNLQAAEALGQGVAADLLDQGAAALIAACRSAGVENRDSGDRNSPESRMPNPESRT